MLRDDSLPHQIRITTDGGGALYVSCTCRKQGARRPGTRSGARNYIPLGYLSKPPKDGEAQRIYKAHLEEEE